nr:ATP-dependent DNA helicase PIF1-like [Tanacetum cinerariifolium]
RLYLSSTSSTRIVDDEQILVLKQFKSDDIGIELAKELLLVESTGAKAETLKNLLMWARNRKYDAATFHCAMRIDKIKTKRGWNYPSCGGEKCWKGNLDRKQGRFWCDSCHSFVEYLVLRRELEVSDDTAQTVVVMFDETARTVVKYLAGSIVASKEQETGLPPALANIVSTFHTLELKSNSYYEHTNYENFTCWSVVLEKALDESGSFRTLAAVGDPNTVTGCHDSDGEESFVAHSKRKRSDVGCSSEVGKWRRLAASSMAEKRATNLKGKAIADAPNVAPPETGCKSREAASISKRITTNLKGKAIADPNNVVTTKTGWKTTGAPSYLCPNYNATTWYEERNNKGNKDQDPTFSLYCQQGKVLILQFKDIPEPLNGLLDYNQPATSSFRDLITVYNEGTQPRYAQLWFFDTHNKIQNRLGAFIDTNSEEGVDGIIVCSLIRMLDANSVIAKAFRMARDWCHADATANMELRLLSERTRSKQCNAPTITEVSALITNDFGDGEPTRDMVVCKKDNPPKRISKLHLSYMALQYPLLFPYGEDGYHEKIPYHTNKGKRKTTRDYVAMKEYYAYVIQYRNDQWTTLHRGGRLFQQYLVDTFTAIEEQRLSWTRIKTPYDCPTHIFCYGSKSTTDARKQQTDDIISAELPSLTVDPTGYKVVSDYMLRGPYGKDNRAAACNVEGKCSKHFPKPFYAETVIDQDGYPIYSPRDDKVSVKKGNFTFDNKHVVPHNLYLLLKYQNQQPVTLHDTDCLPTLVQKEGIDLAMFTDWFDLNEWHPPARTLTYAYIPKHYVWHEKEKKWRPRKQIKCIGRIVYSTPSAGEHYFLRMLLNVNYCLMKIQDLLNTNGRTLTEFSDMPQPNPTLLTSVDNHLIREAQAFDMNKSRIQHQQLYPQLNPEQRLIYEEVVDSVHNKKGQFHFVYGPGGTGKTFLYKIIISRLRSKLKIVLVVASSGIASLLLPGGRTAHSRFVIPLELLENSTCAIKQNTHLAELMQQVELIIWDEALMTQKYTFEALDKTLRDILGYPVPDKQNKIFGGMTVLLGGDFKQILSVLAVGDGKVPTRIKDGEYEPTWIEIPETFHIPSSESPIQQIVEETYSNFIQRQKDDAYLRERAILTP